MRIYCVYILTSHSRVLYIGVTSKLKQRVWQHRHKLVEGFTRRYRVDQLVHFEVFRDVWHGIEREKRLKRWNRARKIALITAGNPEWRDLYDEI